MAFISVIGTSAVGKSFLVKQLAAVTNSPAFFEGEEGTIPEDIMKNVFDGKDPIPRWTFFVKHLAINFEKARAIVDMGYDVYLDDSPLSPEAIIVAEQKQFHNVLRALVEPLKQFIPDLTILLTASKPFIKNQLKKRGRASEQSAKAFDRAMKIQDAYVKLVKKEKNVIVIDRTKLEFTNAKHLQHILAKIKKT